MTEESENAIPTLKCRSNGPCIVTGVALLRDARGASIESKPRYVLCRCGASANKPFCDGSHKKVGFSSVREAKGEGEWARYEGGGVALEYNSGVCAHAGHCTDGLPTVFSMDADPWINPAGADAAAIAAAVARCPSGALRLATANGADSGAEPVIVVSKDGPYFVTGVVALQDEETGRQAATPTRFALCRCGHSRNKPFCDGTHWDAGFRDPESTGPAPKD